MIEGTPENCAALMQQGESILVFPGGSREVMRRKNDGYALFWKQRTGFVKMAVAHGYDILPFASVGPNESFDIHYDAYDILSLNGPTIPIALFEDYCKSPDLCSITTYAVGIYNALDANQIANELLNQISTDKPKPKPRTSNKKLKHILRK